MKNFFAILSILLGLTFGASAQQTIRGTIFDDQSEKPIAGANISIEHSLRGTTTDAKGTFTLHDIAPGDKLRVTHLNYATTTHRVAEGESDLRIGMQEAHININQVVVTGTGTRHRLKDTPIPVSVITAKELRQTSTTDLQSALETFNPSFSFMTNGMGSTMSMNGLPESYVLILENGKKLIGGGTSTTDLNRIDMANVKSIEVVNGAASSLYGSDAVAGVVNIITDDNKKRGINAGSYTRLGSKGRFTQSVNLDASTGKFSSNTSYQRQQADNWRLSEYEENSKTGELQLTNKVASVKFATNSVSQRFSYSPNERLSMFVRGSWYNYATDRPQDAREGTSKPAYSYNLLHQSYAYGAGIKYIISRSAYIDVDFFSDNYSSDYEYFASSGGKKPGDVVNRITNHYYSATAKSVLSLGSRNRMTAGIEFTQDELGRNSTYNIESAKTVYTLSAFAQDEIKLHKNLQGVIGLRYLYNENFKSYATPNVALMYRLKDFNFRGSYAMGYRAPSLYQIHGIQIQESSHNITVGDRNLQPEKSHFGMLSIEYNPTHNVSITAGGYINYLNDMIYYRPIDATDQEKIAAGVSPEEAADYQMLQRYNLNRARIMGFNIGVQAYLGVGFSVAGTYNYANGRDLSAAPDEDDRLDKTIPHAATASLRWSHTWGKYRLLVNFNGRINSRRYSITYGEAPSYQIWNLSTSHAFHVGSVVIEPSIGIENIFNYVDDRIYNSNYATLNPGRSIYFSLDIRFNR